MTATALLLLASLSAAPPLQIPMCRASALRLSLDGRDGDFNGMSHSGTALVVRNVGRACSLPALPTIVFRDGKGRALPAIRRAPVGIRLGPVMVPLRLARGDRAMTELRWVSGPVYESNRRLAPASVALRLGRGIVTARIAAALYGEAGKTVTFEQTPLHPAD